MIADAKFSQLPLRQLVLGDAIKIVAVNRRRVGAADHFLLREIKAPRTISLDEAPGKFFHATFKPAAVELAEQGGFIQPVLGEFAPRRIFVPPPVTRADGNFTEQKCFRVDEE